MLKKLLAGGLITLMFGAFIVNSVSAAGEKFYVQQLYRVSSSQVGVFFLPNNNGTLGAEQSTSFTASNFSSEEALRSGVYTAIVNWANNNGYSGITSSDVYNYAPILATVARTGAFADLSSKPTTLSGYGITDGISTSRTISAGTGLSGGGDLSADRTISMPNVGTAGSYASVTTDAQGRVTAGTNPSDTYPSRTLNSCFQPSATRSTFVNYSIDINTTSTLASGQTGTVYLETFTDSGCTTGTQEVSRFVNGSTVSLAVAITLTQNVTGTITGYIPAGKYVKLRTQNNTGTPTFTYRSGQEVLW